MSADFRRKQQLGELADRIVGSAGPAVGIQSSGERCLPDRECVIQIAKDLKEILFASQPGRRAANAAAARYRVGNLLNRLHDLLTQQIAFALHHDVELGDKPQGSVDFDGLGQEKALAMLESLPRITKLVATDAQAALDGDPAASGIDEVLLCYPGLEAVSIYRLAHELHVLHIPLIPRMLTEWAHARTGIDIHPGAQIGSSFFIDHGTGVVIGATCEIADHVKLYQGVTLGALSFPRDDDGNIIRGRKRHPTIEENVVIYANATVLGGTTIVGAGSIIGASVSLTRSVPPNTVVTIDNKPSLRFRQAS